MPRSGYLRLRERVRTEGEKMVPRRHQWAISTVHPLPVIFIRSSTNETDLIVLLAIATESRPSKPMGAKFPEKSLQEFHVCPLLTRLLCYAETVRLKVVRACAPVR
jgi:hypothetical protein